MPRLLTISMCPISSGELLVVVQKCASPVCGGPFLQFRNGQIYRLDRRDVATLSVLANARGPSQRLYHSDEKEITERRHELTLWSAPH